MNLPVRSEPATLVRVSAQLHLFDAVEGVFMLQDENIVASVLETGSWECTSPLTSFINLFPDWLSVATPKKTWISQQMEAEMNPVFNYVSLLGHSPLTFVGAPFVHLELL